MGRCKGKHIETAREQGIPGLQPGMQRSYRIAEAASIT